MFRKITNPILFIPLILCVTSNKVILSETKNYIDQILQEKGDKIFVNYEEIDEFILNNEELKSLEKLVSSASLETSPSLLPIRCISLDTPFNNLANELPTAPLAPNIKILPAINLISFRNLKFFCY